MRAVAGRALLTALLVAAGSSARAAPVLHQDFPVERLRLAPGATGLLDAQSGAVMPHLRWSVGLWAGYVHEPLVARSPIGTTALVDDRVGVALIGAVGLFNRVEVGFELPTVAWQTRADSLSGILDYGTQAAPLASYGLGDLRLAPKVQILRQAAQGVDLAVVLGFALPTAGAASYLGDRSVTGLPELAVSYTRPQLRFALNLGGLIRGSRPTQGGLSVGSELNARLGVGVRFKETLPLELQTSLAGSTSVTDLLKPAAEARLGLACDVWGSLQVFAGAGVGLSQGFGTPDWRSYAGLRFTAPEHREAVKSAVPASPPPPVVVEVPPPPVVEPPPPPTPSAPPPEPLETIHQKLDEFARHISFVRDSDELLPESQATLEAMAKHLLDHPEAGRALIEGHTDNVGSAKKNQELSERRALAVMNWLVEHGVNESRLGAVGFGATKPIADNSTPEGRAKNRRVELKLPDTGHASGSGP